jgi:hypothetical protein
MALYLAKVHGRNRGYGIHELVDDENETLAAVEHDLEAALRDGLVDVHILSGADLPRTQSTPATAASTTATRH